MERLTKWLNNKKAICYEVCEKECTEGYYECHKCKPFADAMKKLAEYEDLEEQGLLLRLPCKVGDTFWELNNSLLEPCVYPRVAHSLQHVAYCMDRLSKSTFLTKAEAEAALVKMKGEERETD